MARKLLSVTVLALLVAAAFAQVCCTVLMREACAALAYGTNNSSDEAGST